ncbi:MAG: hypothetical protein Q8862_01365 [Bacteroidota bacterium]|nr:hypothetical protein [Bacteroidota bacterium]
MIHKEKRKYLCYPEIVGVLIGCPFVTPYQDCPFEKYREKLDKTSPIALLASLDEQELEALSRHHSVCHFNRRQKMWEGYYKKK